jgi:hypothetical protein
MVEKEIGTLGNHRTENYGGRKTQDGLFGIDKNKYIWGKSQLKSQTFYRDPNEKPSLRTIIEG